MKSPNMNESYWINIMKQKRVAQTTRFCLLYVFLQTSNYFTLLHSTIPLFLVQGLLLLVKHLLQAKYFYLFEIDR